MNLQSVNLMVRNLMLSRPRCDPVPQAEDGEDSGRMLSNSENTCRSEGNFYVEAMAKAFVVAAERHDSDRINLILGRVGIEVLLHHAAQHGNDRVLRHLLDVQELDVNVQDEMGYSALILASWKGHTECVRLLLRKGVDVLIVARDNLTCLHMAAFYGHIEVVNLLLHGKSPRECLDGWDPSIPFLSWRHRWALMNQRSSSESSTALHMAAVGGHDQGVAIAASLLEAYRTSVLESYGLKSNPKVAYGIENELWWDYLLQVRNELNLQDGDNFPQAILENLASYRNHSGSALNEKLLDKYEGLVRSYVDLLSYSNARDRIGRTALHYAAWENRAEVVKFLIWDTQIAGPQDSQLGSVANINITDVDGYTPLHFASRNGSTDAAVALLRENIVAKDMELSPRQNRLVKKIYLQPNAAARPNHRSGSIATEIQGALQKLGNGQNECDRSALRMRPHLQKLGSHSQWVENRAGITPLHYAVEKGHTEIVKSLVEHRKINVFQCTSDGQSPWTIAFPPRLKLSKCPATDIQRLLRSGSTNCGRAKNPTSSWAEGEFEKHRSYRKHLLKQAAALAVVADHEGNSDIDAADQFVILEMQIFVTFLENLTGTAGPYQKLPSTFDKSFKVIRPAGKKKNVIQRYLNIGENVMEVNSYLNNWENVMESYLCSDSKYMERISLLHVASFEGFDQELETLLALKSYKERINDRENMTCSGYTALHFAAMKCKTDTRALAVLLNETTLDPTTMNKKRQTPLHIVEHKLRSDRSRPLLDAKRLLMRRPEVQQFWEHLYRDRQIYVDAANALLVGAALIASISFAGWLQPPMKLTDDLTTMSSNGRIYTMFISLCFCSSLASMVTGATAALPSAGHFIEKEVVIIRRWLVVTSAFLAFSIYCILIAFVGAHPRQVGNASQKNIFLLFFRSSKSTPVAPSPSGVGSGEIEANASPPSRIGSAEMITETIMAGNVPQGVICLVLLAFFFRLLTTRIATSRVMSIICALAIIVIAFVAYATLIFIPLGQM